MKFKLYWLGFEYRTKSFISIGGFKSRYIIFYDIVRYRKHHEKKFGRWDFIAQDDIISFFSFYPFAIMWGCFPDRQFVMDNKEKL